MDYIIKYFICFIYVYLCLYKNVNFFYIGNEELLNSLFRLILIYNVNIFLIFWKNNIGFEELMWGGSGYCDVSYEFIIGVVIGKIGKGIFKKYF